MRPRRALTNLTLTALALLLIAPATRAADTIYHVEDGTYVRHNGDRYHNRPLYGANLPSVLLAGDKPHVRFVSQPCLGGYLMIAYVRGEQAKWLHDFAQITSRYNPGSMAWSMSDPAFGDLGLTLEAVTVAEGSGFALKLTPENHAEGDQLVWSFGGMSRTPDDLTLWHVDPATHPQLLAQGFVPDECEGDRVELADDRFRLTLDPLPANTPPMKIIGRCGWPTTLKVTDANQWQNPHQLIASTGDDRPLATGVTTVPTGPTRGYWLVRASANPPEDRAAWLADAEQAFDAGMQRVRKVAGQVTISTPDPRLDAALAACVIAIDGAWYPPVYVHGAMSWNVPYPGWRTIYGPTTLGWHENVLAEAKHYIGAQKTEPSFTECHANPNLGLTVPGPESRFYGQGRIALNQGFYNFQEVFFDQMIHAWRWTGDPELQKILKPALERHLDWMRDCFDPDGNGVYESVINVWASDSVWYSGGETAQSTAYAYRGHVNLMDMALKREDGATAERHRLRAETIRNGMMEALWMPDQGYLAEYRDIMGTKRQHPDAGLYTIFLPIDAGMMNPIAAAQMLHYTEWGLEREPMPAGGEMCWQSNWVPWYWSTRERAIAESCHLALAYYQTGRGQEAWKLIEGAFAESTLNSSVPGGLQLTGGATDFNDGTSMFARVIVEGLFGIRPDRPAEVVHCYPQLPYAWKNAQITTPEFSMTYERGDDYIDVILEQDVRSKIDFVLPMYARDVVNATINGKRTQTNTIPGFGCTLVQVSTTPLEVARVRLTLADPLPYCPPIAMDVKIGEDILLTPEHGGIVKQLDPQAILKNPEAVPGDEDDFLDDGLKATVASKPGHHLALTLVRTGRHAYTQLYEFNISDPAGEQRDAERNPRRAPADATFATVDLADALNGDVRTIFKQEYLSPRPSTCSAQIGTDGRSPWTFYHWNMKPPAIELDGIPALLDQDGRIVTPQNVPFAWPGNERNIAFTSLWDNWPDEVTVDINAQGSAVWFLVAGSTNPMQTGLANGVIRLNYADGETDELELVAPDNYWSLEANYNYARNGFALPNPPPETVQLGDNNRAMVLGRSLRPDVALKSVTLQTLSQEVVVGLMGVSVMK